MPSTLLPTGPWKMLAMDFLGPFPSGDYLLVVIDEYSRFLEVERYKTPQNHYLYIAEVKESNIKFPFNRIGTPLQKSKEKFNIFVPE